MTKKVIFRIITTSLLVLTVAFILGNSLKTATESSAQSGKVQAFLQETANAIFPNNPPTVTSNFVRKAAHFCEFALLGFIAYFTYISYADNKKFLFTVLLFGLLIAILDETVQLFVSGRVGQVKDVLLDFCGHFIGGIFAFAIYTLTIKIIASKKKISYERR